VKSKIIFEKSNEKSGISVVGIQNKYGKFFGYSSCSPDDMKNFSQFSGCRYAELRAYKEFAKFRLKQEKVKLETIKNLIKDINYSVDYINEDNSIMRKINLKLRDYTQSVSDWENLYNFYEYKIKDLDKERQDILTRYNK
jgi:hypothetical protein